jgi:hypothetical protein
MHQSIKKALHFGAIVTLIVLIVLPVSYSWRGVEAPGGSNKVSDKGVFNLPQGLQSYTIAQAAEVWPRIVEATIDPLDVHVGDRQTIEVVIESRSPIDSVTSRIETDNNEVLLPLEYVGVADKKTPSPFAGHLKGYEEESFQFAQAQETFRARYRGDWVVADTHNRNYYNIITAKAGSDESSVTLTWSDACGIPAGGDFTLSSTCTIASPDGVDNGSLTVNSSLTLNANFAYNSGRSISIGTGSIALCSGCSIVKTNIWVVDADGDTYPGGGMTLADNNPGGGTRRYLASGTPDCYDSNADAHPNLFATYFFTTHRGDGSWDYDCDGDEQKQYPSLAGCAQYGNPADSSGWHLLPAQIPACGEYGYLVIQGSLCLEPDDATYDPQPCR